VVQDKQVPKDLEETAFALGPDAEMGLLALLVKLGLTTANSEGRRLVEQRAVRIDGEVVGDGALHLGPGRYLIKVGKRRFARVHLS
jgi:tyrosyl-tRNA synthetase